MASDEPPPPLKSGLGYKIFNSFFAWIYEHIYLPGDDSIFIIPGEGGKPGRIYSRGGAGVAQTRHAWKPYLSPTATGSPSQKKRTIRIRVGTVNGSPPTSPNIEIIVPPNKPDGYFVWLDVDVNSSGQMTAYNYGHGDALPAAPAIPTDGTPPTKAYDCIFVVTSTEDAVRLPAQSQLRWTPLTLAPIETNRTLTQLERRMKFDGPGGLEDIPA